MSAQSLDRIYRTLPRIKCKGLCYEACGPIAGAEAEIERVERVSGQALSIRPDGACSMLTADNRCSVYAARPLICRLFGAAEGLECPHGCEPERVLSRREAYDAMKRVERVAGPPRMCEVPKRETAAGEAGKA